jgi:hypothetical protein
MRERALLLALIFCSLSACIPLEDQEQGMTAAVDHAIKEARKIQAQLAQTGKCPDAMPGWHMRELLEQLETRAGTEKVSYPLVLDCYQDKDAELKFGIIVEYSFDSQSWVSGAATGPLEVEYGHFTAPCTFSVSPLDESYAAATHAVHDRCNEWIW